VTHGQFEYVTNSGVAITSFTQTNVTASQVQFVHDSSMQAPSYNVVVFDGSDRTTPPLAASITFNTIDIPPALTNKTMTLLEGQTTILSSNELRAMSVRIADDAVIYTLSNVQYGQFNRLDGVTEITTFTQADIDNGEIVFVHDGGETKPEIDITLSDGQLVSGQESVVVDFIPSNDMPSLVNNRLSVSPREQSVILTADQLSATDADNDDETLIFEVSDVLHGWFEKVAAPGESIRTFFQSEVTNGDIRFVHDGSDQAPSYQVRVSDGELRSAYQRATIEFGDLSKTSSPAVRQAPLLSWSKLRTGFFQYYEQLTTTLRQYLLTDESELIKQQVSASLQPRLNDWLNRYEALHKCGECDDVSRWFNYGLEDCKSDLMKLIERGELTESKLNAFEQAIKGLQQTYLSPRGLLQEQQRPKGFMAVSSNRMTLWNRQGTTTTRELLVLTAQSEEVAVAGSGLLDTTSQTVSLLGS